MSLNHQQILQLAPDDASAKAGVQLSGSSKWLTKCVHPLALWGECQGSGKNPYKTFIDLSNIAFKCSCPSRKFPCKHGLGLFLLYADNPSLFSTVDKLPPEIEEWVSKRAGKTEPKEQTEKKPVDEAAQQKRTESREKKIIAGIEELQLWIKDVARTGIMNVPQNQYAFATNIIARMIDCQAPGLAYQLKKINKIDVYKEGWQKSLTKILSKTYLLAESYKNKDDFDILLKEDIDSLIGWTKSKEEVLANNPVRDEWIVLSKLLESEASLTTESIWLYGLNSGKFALLLNYYAGNQIAVELLPVGYTMQAELVFYPSVFPLRALIKSRDKQQNSLPEPMGTNDLESIKNKVADVLSIAPFIENLPLLISNFRIAFLTSTWYLIDHASKGMSIINSDDECWNILSISKGNVFTCFGIYANDTIDIHSLWFEQKFYMIK